MKHNFTKIGLRLISVIAIMATLLIGAFSYFTDYESTTLSAKAGTLALSMTDATEDLTGGLTILNPGDVNDLTFTATNSGEKSMDVKAVITLTSSKELTESAHEYKITDGQTELTGVLSDNRKTITYSVDDVLLSGSIEKDGTDTSHKYNYKLEMDSNASNAWQGSEVEVKVELFAKQHRNTDELSSDWTAIVEK